MTNPGESWLDRKTAVVIINPAAHNLPAPRRLEEAAELFRQEGWSVQWWSTTAAGQATAMAAEAAAQHVPLVFACGGDGTLNEVVNGLAGTETALAVIPAGTTNLWARELRIHRKTPVEAVRLALDGERRRIDLGRAGSRYFLCMASYGIDAQVTAEIDRSIKRRFGALAYALSSLRVALRYRGTPASVRLDGEDVRGEVLMVIAGNTRQYAGLTQVVPEAIVDDGLLDFRIFLGRGRRSIVLHALRALFRLHRRSPRVLYRRAARMKLSSERPLTLQLDGDYVPESSGEVTVCPDALWAVIPAGTKAGIFTERPDHPPTP